MGDGDIARPLAPMISPGAATASAPGWSWHAVGPATGVRGDDEMQRAPVSQRCYIPAMVTRIISGGQTGADQAGLAVAKRLGIPTAGFIPKGFLTEAGPRPDLAAEYGLTTAYQQRTERNVRLADGTVVFGDARSPGSMLTIGLCRRHGRPCVTIPPNAAPDQAARQLRAWLDELRIASSTWRATAPARPRRSPSNLRAVTPPA